MHLQLIADDPHNSAENIPKFQRGRQNQPNVVQNGEVLNGLDPIRFHFVQCSARHDEIIGNTADFANYFAADIADFKYWCPQIGQSEAIIDGFIEGSPANAVGQIAEPS